MQKTTEPSEKKLIYAGYIDALKRIFCSDCEIKLESIVKIVFALTIILFAYNLIFDSYGVQYTLFFRKFEDLFADFFNPIIYASECNPYFALDNTGPNKINPPLHYLLAYFCHLAIGIPLTLKEMLQNKIAIACIVSFLVVSEIFLFFMLSKFSNGKNKFLLLLLFFSGVNLFSMERGTLVIFTTGCVAGFLHYYQSTERKKQIFALILLSLAAALKIYPALFGLLLLKKNDFKGILFCFILTSALGFVPLLFFEGGFSSITLLFNNLKAYRIVYDTSPGALSLSQILNYYFGIRHPEIIVDQWLKVVDWLAIGTMFISFFGGKKENLCLSIASVMILCPIGAMPYTQLYLFPSFILFVDRIKQNFSKADLFLAAGYILMFMPFQMIKNINKSFVCTILPLMLTIVLIREISDIKKRRNKSAVRNIENI